MSKRVIRTATAATAFALLILPAGLLSPPTTEGQSPVFGGIEKVEYRNGLYDPSTGCSIRPSGPLLTKGLVYGRVVAIGCPRRQLVRVCVGVHDERDKWYVGKCQTLGAYDPQRPYRYFPTPLTSFPVGRYCGRVTSVYRLFKNDSMEPVNRVLRRGPSGRTRTDSAGRRCDYD